jgi:alpha-galactosidase
MLKIILNMNKLILVLGILIFLSCSNQPKSIKQEGSPVINSPMIVGNYPNTSFLFTVPAQGIRPMKFTAKGLPRGLVMDGSTGIISGNAKDQGDYAVNITVENSKGVTSSVLTIKIGDLLALTPPMGWNSWNTFTDQLCDSLVRQIADSMVSNGMRDLGYQYVNIDDFWQLVDRDVKGNIQINRDKFPKGIRAVADYLHSKGLKLGIYSDAAGLTCGGVAGSFGHEEQDARDFAAWGVDLLKYDYCHAPDDKETAINRYTRMAEALKKTNRSIVFSVCEWGQREPWTWAAGIGGNYWRTTWDIRNAWNRDIYDAEHNSIMQITDINAPLADHASPGHWNDPDMLVIGIYDDPRAVVNVAGAKGCTDEEYRSHMSLWCLMASPLLCGNDIRNMNQVTKDILLNPEIIAVNQDPLGKQAKKVRDDGDVEVFAKPMADGSWAVGLLNRKDSAEIPVRISWNELGIEGGWMVRDLWDHRVLGNYSGYFEKPVLPHQCAVIRIYK